MPFKNENVAVGLPEEADLQVGVSDWDRGRDVEAGVFIPLVTDPQGTYVYYECSIGSMLDSGIVVHNRLPQVDNKIDTLAAGAIDDSRLAQVTNFGVNLDCHDQYEDIVQRMGHSRYWFRLWGMAMRIGFQIPIPGLVSIGGVRAIPYDKNPQWGINAIVGNYGSVVLWRAAWSLWYTTAVPPVNNTIPAVDLATMVTGDTTPPAGGIQAPHSPVDDDAISSPGRIIP